MTPLQIREHIKGLAECGKGYADCIGVIPHRHSAAAGIGYG
jgi:hypothetical protein